MPFATPDQTIVTRGGRRVVVGPSGVAWTPVPEIAAKVLGFWDASAPGTVSETGGFVTEWRDGANGIPLRPLDETDRPSFTQGDWGVDFDNLDRVFGDVPGLVHGAGKELWVLCHATAPDPRQDTSAVACVIGDRQNGTYANVFSINRNAFIVEPFQRQELRYTRGSASLFVSVPGEWPVDVATFFRGRSAVDEIKFVKNGTQIATRVASGAIPDASGVCIGGQPNQWNAFIGDVAIVVLAELLTDPEAAALTAYMASRAPTG